MTSETLAQLRESQFPIIGVGGVSPKSISEGNIPRCDGYAILTPVLNALGDPAKWHRELGGMEALSPWRDKMMQSQKIEKMAEYRNSSGYQSLGSRPAQLHRRHSTGG